MKLKFYSDSGHGWLKTSRKMLEKIGIENLVSSYSYQKGINVYLEEDCDAGLLLDALKIHGIDYKIETIRSNRSSIRNYQGYRA